MSGSERSSAVYEEPPKEDGLPKTFVYKVHPDSVHCICFAQRSPLGGFDLHQKFRHDSSQEWVFDEREPFGHAGSIKDAERQLYERAMLQAGYGHVVESTFGSYITPFEDRTSFATTTEAS